MRLIEIAGSVAWPILRRHLLAQPGVNERVNFAIQHGLGIAGFKASALIFHHLIGMKNVGAYAAAKPACTRSPLISVRSASFFCRSISYSLPRARGSWTHDSAVGLRSFWHVTTRPLGRCATRTGR